MTNLEFQGVVVVGAGPAGIVCALELASEGVDVLLVESGASKYSPRIQKLGDLDRFDRKRHAPMEIATRRQIGGTSVIWGGRCVPFDPIDFDKRTYIPFSTWPIDYKTVGSYHDKASYYFRSGRSVFSSHHMETVRQKTILPSFEEGDVLASDLERWSLPTDFGKEYGKELSVNKRIKILDSHTAVEIVVEDASSQVKGIRLRSIGGSETIVKGNRYIIACGGLETTRLLMQPTSRFPNGLGNSGGWLGRCYMGHLSGQIARARFYGDPKRTVFGFHRDSDGTYVRQRFTFSSEAQKKSEIANTAIWLVNPKIGDPSHGNGVLSFAYLALSSRFGKFFASDAIRQSAIADSPEGAFVGHCKNIVMQSFRTAAFIPTFGYKRFLVRRRVPGFFQYSASNNYPIHYHAEHIPNPASCVTLSSSRDELGMRKLDVDIRFSEQDVQSIVTSHEILDRELRRQRLGELQYFAEDLKESIWAQAEDGFHQAGTTRMSIHTKDGVVNEDCRVHGQDNLYVASSSVFVTSGQANSTFLVVALAVRLAKHIATLEKQNKQ